MNKLALKKRRYAKRRLRIKNRVRSGNNSLRLCINRSNRNFFAQIIDDSKGQTILGLSTLSGEFADIKNRGNIESVKKLGKLLAEKAVKNGVKKVVFDRNGFLFHGKVKAFVDSVRENGLEV